MLFKSFNLPRNGVTLIETLIFTAIGSMVLLALGSMFYSGLNTRASIDAQERLSVVERSIGFFLNEYAYDAISMPIPATGTGNEVVFINVDNRTVDFIFTGNDVEVWIDGLLVESLSTLDVEITDFSVTKLSNADPDAVKIDVTLRASVFRSRTVSQTQSFTFVSPYDASP